jgi:hypothetical protein
MAIKDSSSSHDLLPKKAQKPLLASILFPELKRELEEDASLVGNLQGFFILTVKGSNNNTTEEW